MLINENLVKISNAVLSWDGLRNPETRQSGSISYNVSVLIALNTPEYAELDAMAARQLQSGVFRGVMPPNGRHPLTGTTAKPKIPEPAKFGAQFSNHISIAAGTSRGIPTIVDINGAPMAIMQAGPMLYPGCIVSVLVDTWEYDNKEKGVAFGLQGLQIIDATAPKLAVAGGMSADDVTNAFSGQGAPIQTPTAVVPNTTITPSMAAAAPAPGTVAPAPEFNAGPTPKQMTAKADGVSYEAFIAKGWTDDALIAQGYMVG